MGPKKAKGDKGSNNIGGPSQGSVLSKRGSQPAAPDGTEMVLDYLRESHLRSVASLGN